MESERSAARGLCDADRQPRRHHAARARRAPRRRSRARRGHAPHAGLLERHGIRAGCSRYHEHNEAARVAEVLPRLAAGERIALVTDAGLPAVSDPGARLVRAALDAGVAGDGAAGAVGGRDRARRKRSRGQPLRVRRVPAAEGGRAGGAVARDGGVGRAPVVAFESPQRLPATLRSLARVRRRIAQAAVCRELTKHFEEVARGTAAELAERFAEPPKGEITLVVGPAPRAVSDCGPRGALAAVSRARRGRNAAPCRRRRRGAAHGRRATSSTGALCDNSVISFDNDDRRPYRGNDLFSSRQRQI